jgi:hypothetical protein
LASIASVREQNREILVMKISLYTILKQSTVLAMERSGFNVMKL